MRGFSRSTNAGQPSIEVEYTASDQCGRAAWATRLGTILPAGLARIGRGRGLQLCAMQLQMIVLMIGRPDLSNHIDATVDKGCLQMPEVWRLRLSPSTGIG